MVLEAGEAARRGKERCVCVIPCSMVSKLAGNTGRSVDLAAGASGDVLNLSAPDECAAAITVTITLQSNTGAPRRGFATVRWGTGGHQAQAEVDCSRGTCFSIFASSLRLTITNGGNTAAVAGAFVGTGATPPIPPTRTIEFPSLAVAPGVAGSNTASENIPNFAAAVWIYRNDPALPMRARLTAPGGVNVFHNLPPFEDKRIVLSGFATILTLANDDPDSVQNAPVGVFELTL